MPTLLIGAHFRHNNSHGIMLAADRRSTRGDRVMDEKKLFLMHKNQIAIAFSGLTGIAIDFRRILKDDSNFIKAETIYQAIEAMKEVIVGICSTYHRRETFSSEEPVFEAIVCGLEHLTRGEPVLCRLNHKGYSEEIPRDSTVPYYTTGRVGAYAHSLMKVFYKRDVSRETIAEVSSHIFWQIRLMDAKVGDIPDIVIVEPNTLPEMIDEDEVLKIVKKVKSLGSTLAGDIIELLRLSEEEEAHIVFEKYLVENLLGVTKGNRKITISLDYAEGLKPQLILGKTASRYVAHNQSPVEKNLFVLEGESCLVTKGSVTIPPSLSREQIPNDITKIWDLISFQVQGEDRKVKKTVKWIDERGSFKRGYLQIIP